MDTTFSKNQSPKSPNPSSFPSSLFSPKLATTPKMKKWTPDEDALLEKYQKRFGNKWNKIAALLPNRTPSQCSQRFRRKFKPEKIRTPWTEEEDSKVKDLVKKNGKNWQMISDLMKTRTAKQIRDRFTNILDRNINKVPFTAEEDQLLMKYYKVGLYSIFNSTLFEFSLKN